MMEVRRRTYIWRGGVTIPLKVGVLCFRPPWNPPLFSERYGHITKMLFRLAGFRVFIR